MAQAISPFSRIRSSSLTQQEFMERMTVSSNPPSSLGVLSAESVDLIHQIFKSHFEWLGQNASGELKEQIAEVRKRLVSLGN